ncbi:MAG: hypothetical protein IKT00_14445 [Prevotella sp.]|nr:hypothetical protein [Prevotella sp.]
MKKHLPHGRPCYPPVLIIFLLLSSLVARAQSPDMPDGLSADAPRTPGVIEYAWHLVVWHKDGSKATFLLDEMPQVIHDGDKVIVKSSSIVEYDFRAIRKMTYSLEEVTSIREMAVREGIPFSTNGGTIIFEPADKELHVQVFQTNGMTVKDLMVRKGESATITLPSSPEKIYLVKVNGVTYKIRVP